MAILRVKLEVDVEMQEVEEDNDLEIIYEAIKKLQDNHVEIYQNSKYQIRLVQI